jgi:hypothetical protein
LPQQCPLAHCPWHRPQAAAGAGASAPAAEALSCGAGALAPARSWRDPAGAARAWLASGGLVGCGCAWRCGREEPAWAAVAGAGQLRCPRQCLAAVVLLAPAKRRCRRLLVGWRGLGGPGAEPHEGEGSGGGVAQAHLEAQAAAWPGGGARRWALPVDCWGHGRAAPQVGAWAWFAGGVGPATQSVRVVPPRMARLCTRVWLVR